MTSSTKKNNTSNTLLSLEGVAFLFHYAIIPNNHFPPFVPPLLVIRTVGYFTPNCSK